MNTLIYTSVLGFLCMVAEMLNLRKIIVPAVVAGLVVILGVTLQGWGLNEGFYHNMVVIDNFSVAFSGLIILLAIFLILLSADFYTDEKSKISDYLAVLVFTVAGAVGLISFGNLAMFFISLEVMSISLYILAGSKRKDVRSNEAGMKYFLMGSFATGILLFGIALIYGETASFDLKQITAYTTTHQPSVMYYLGAGMILMGLLFKMSAVPFHFWAPDVYEGAPTLITTLMATISKLAALAAIYRLFSYSFLPTISQFAWALSAITALTITVGNFTALHQTSFKRLLAYSGISHAGYLLMGIVAIYGKTDNAIFYYSLAYGLSTLAAFAVTIVVIKNIGTDAIESFNGLGKRRPMLALALTIALLSLAGIPPFAGFFGKYYIFTEAIKNGHILLTVVAVINSLVAIFYYFKVILAMYTEEGDETTAFAIKPAYGFVIALCVILTVLVGVFPSTFANLF